MDSREVSRFQFQDYDLLLVYNHVYGPSWTWHMVDNCCMPGTGVACPPCYDIKQTRAMLNKWLKQLRHTSLTDFDIDIFTARLKAADWDPDKYRDLYGGPRVRRVWQE